VELAQDINAEMPTYVAARIVDALGARGVSTRNAHVFALGVTYKPDVGDLRESAAVATLAALARRGVQVSYHDPFVAEVHGPGLDLKRRTLTPRRLAEADLVAVLTPHTSYDLDSVLDHARLVFDARDALGRRNEDKVVTL
jgi:UDP-N-acetyl-D-glucosamine dehydrogenase